MYLSVISTYIPVLFGAFHVDSWHGAYESIFVYWISGGVCVDLHEFAVGEEQPQGQWRRQCGPRLGMMLVCSLCLLVLTSLLTIHILEDGLIFKSHNFILSNQVLSVFQLEGGQQHCELMAESHTRGKKMPTETTKMGRLFMKRKMIVTFLFQPSPAFDRAWRNGAVWQVLDAPKGTSEGPRGHPMCFYRMQIPGPRGRDNT